MLGLKTKTFAPNCPPVVDGATTPAAGAVGAATAAGIAGIAAKQAPASMAAAMRTTRRGWLVSRMMASSCPAPPWSSADTIPGVLRAGNQTAMGLPFRSLVLDVRNGAAP